jgi:site-specific DNA recombinase
VLTDENLTNLVRMVNEEIRLLAGRRREHLEEIQKQLESVNQKLLRLYMALETGSLDLDDLAPRIKDLRAEQTRLQRARDEALVGLEDTAPKKLDREQVLSYAQDLKGLLSQGTFIEQKTFLRSFISRIEFEPGQVAINYIIPLPVEKDRTSEREVLSIRRLGSAYRIRTGDLLLEREVS